MTDKQAFTGSCHCKHIRYEVAFPPTQPNVKRCNCTYCQKPGFTSLYTSLEDFKLITPASKAEVSDYFGGSKDVHRYFCGKCGVHIWREARYNFGGKVVDMFSVNLLSLDQPQDGLELSEIKFKYTDGLHNNHMAGEKEVPWSGGVV